MKVIIKPIDSDYVYRWDKVKLNTNNYYTLEGREQPADYDSVCRQTNTGNWIDRFHDSETIQTLDLDSEDLEWMQKARQIGRMTRKFSQLYQDELEETLAKHQEKAKFVEKGGWFIRTERVSLKNGEFGAGPYDSLEKVLKSLVSSNPGHDCFSDSDQTLRLYFMPFQKELEMEWEFRVFVHQGQITAISQQNLFCRYDSFKELAASGQLEELIQEKILGPYLSLIKPRMEGYMDSYTMDLALLGKEKTAYFIEPNSFGADYPAGAALFDWKNDDHVLRGDGSEVEFRYTV